MKMITSGLIVCLVVVLGHSASIIKSKQQPDYCSWGAQYWCSSPQTAELCGKSKWCAQNDWAHDVVEDFDCTVTQHLVKNVRNLIKDASTKPMTEHDFAQFIAKGCTVFKDDKDKLKCKELVTREAVLLKLLQLVDSKMTAQSVAIAVGVCKRNILTEKPCLRCADVISTAQKYISKYLTREIYSRLIENQCAKLGQGHQLCQVIGQAKFEQFYNELISAPAQSVCEGKTQCLSMTTELTTVKSTALCENCKIVVAEIRELDRNQDVQAAIRNLIKLACSKLGEFKQLCDTLTDEALDYLFELIATEMEPERVCEELKLCGSPESEITKLTSATGSFECTVCEFILKEIDLLIGDNSTEEKLKHYLDIFCSRLPSTVSAKCEAFVTQYTPLIIKAILKDLAPNLVCTALGVCKNGTGLTQAAPVIPQPVVKANDETSQAPSSTPQLAVKTIDETSQATPVILQSVMKANDLPCDLCKYVVSYLDIFLQKNSTDVST